MDDYSSGFCIRASRGGGGGGGGTGSKCGRWNPTSEQVKVLTELFRSGLRTPTTDQIQKISSELSFYGKIESKNVFYWFQNHKARERHKRRRVFVDEHETINDQIIVHHPNHSKNVSNAKNHIVETNVQVSEPERVVETLQLFPLNTSSEGTTESEKLRLYRDDCKENSCFAYNFGTEMDHPTLDLRLSFA